MNLSERMAEVLNTGQDLVVWTANWIHEVTELEAHIRELEEKFGAVEAEMERQLFQWGEQNHPDEWYFPILVEEIGEIGTAMLEYHFQDECGQYDKSRSDEDIQKELVQAIAVGISWLQCRARRIRE